MENQSISAHIVVISQSSGKLPDAKANSLPDADSAAGFAHVLAAQIQGESKGAVIPDVANSSQSALEDADKTAKEAESDSVAAGSIDLQSANQLINTLNSLQLPHVQNTQSDVQVKESTEKTDTDLFVSNLTAKPVATTDLAAGLDKAAKEVADPAKIAVGDKSLPIESFHDIKTETNNLSQTSLANLTQLNRAAPLPANAAPVAPPAIEIPVGHAGWDAAFSQRVAWVATNTQQVAHLQLNPPNLGPLEIRISLSSDQTNAAFTSPHAAVRDAIEAALPRLREMLADNGLSLGNVNVSSQSFQQQQQQQSQTGQGHSQRYDPFQELQRITASGSSAAFTSQGIGAITHANNSLVDIFA